MTNLPRKQALAQIEKYRPLCDGDGYPLVGNLARKIAPSPGQEAGPDLTASALCAEIRARGAR